MADSIANADPLAPFDRLPITFDGETYDVFMAGDGPAVVVLPEMPGLTPDVAASALRFVEAGYSVYVPSLFGTPGRKPSNSYIAASMARACVSRRFAAFARSTRAPIIDWLQKLVRHAHAERGGAGVGVIGMCFTGNFALALAVDPAVLVPVMSQPSLPLGISKKAKCDLHVSADDLGVIRKRTDDDNLCVIGLRFTGDGFVPGERFETLRREFGDAFIGVEIDSSEGNERGFHKDAHSVLTIEYRRELGHPTNDAMALVLDHFQARLKA